MSTNRLPQRPQHLRRAGSLGILSGVLASSLLAASPAGAEEPAGGDGNAVRYERKSAKVQTKSNLDTKFKDAQKQAEADKKKQVKMMDAEDFAREREAVTQEYADKQIGVLIQLIKNTEKTDPEMPDLLFRLSDHHLEKKAYFERQAGALYDKIYAAQEAGKKAEANQFKEKQKRFEAQAKASSGEAVKVYKLLVTDSAFSKYKRLDEAIYFYAFELGQLNREAEMKDAYLRLIREYPTSKYIPNAYLSFADYYYGNNQIADALTLYQKIVDGYKDSPVYAYALYKMGWCYLNPIGTAEPEYTKSLNKFVETVKATIDGRAGSEANAKQLRRDARRDLVKAYVHSGKPSKAWDFFTTVGSGPKKDEDMSKKMMELLAAAYFGEGMYVESSSVYKKLQELFESDQDVCDWQYHVVVNALATDDKQIQWIETEKLAGYWDKYKASQFKEPVKKACRDEARDTVKQMATVWHDEAEKTRKQDTYDLSEKAYRAFMQYFPQDKDAYELNYYYADLLWAQADHAYNSKDKTLKAAGLKKFREAHEEFLHVLERKPDGKYTKDAAYAQMLAMKNALEYDETGAQGKACKVNTEGVCVYKEKKKEKKVGTSKDTQTDVNLEYPESDYTSEESEMIKAYDTYQKYVKDAKDPELPKIVYHRVKLMMVHNKFKEAKPLAIDLISKFDGSIYAAWASEMLVDMLTIQWTNKNNTPDDTIKYSNELEEWANKLKKAKVWKHEEADRVREAVPTLLAGIGWKRAEAYQEQGKQGDPAGYKKCGNEYVQIWNDFETHPRADILLFNAARCFEAGFLVGNAINMRKELLSRYPKSEVYNQTLKELGQNYQAIAYYEDAATRFEEYATKNPKDKFSSEALNNAYLFRLGLGQQEKAAADLAKYEDYYKKKDVTTAAKIYWSKHSLLTDDASKLAHAKAYLSTYGGKGGADRQAVAEAAIGQILWRQSCDKELLYDSCITVQRKKANAGEAERKKAEKLRKKAKKKKDALPKYCGTETQALITVHKRDGKKAAEAMSHFDAVLRASSKKPNIPAEDLARVDDYKNAIGMAMVYTADKKYEEYLSLEIPDNLFFGAAAEEWKKELGGKYEKEYKDALAKETDSKKRFSEWFDRKSKLGVELIESYAKVRGSGSPFWTLAAAARTALVNRNFADQLYRAPVPDNLKNEDQMYAYCDELAIRYGDPLTAKAKDALEYCLSRSTEFQFFNTFSRMCEEELQQSDADKYPATNELFGTSIYTDSHLDVVGVQTDIDGTKKKADKGDAKSGDKGEDKGDDEDADGDSEGASAN